MPAAPSGTVTFLFTDIEGSTRLWERWPEKMDGALRRHDELLRRAFEDYGGYVFATTDDGFAVAFSDAASAVRTAVAAQRAISSEAWRPLELRVRMALDTGAAFERGGDYFGPSVNRAARILEVARGGQIVASSTTADLIRRRLPEGVTEKPLGRRHLRDVADPVGLVNVAYESATPMARGGRLLLASMSLLLAIGLALALLQVRGGSPSSVNTTASMAEAARQMPEPMWTTVETDIRADLKVRPVILGGGVYLATGGTGDGELVGLELIDGDMLWSHVPGSDVIEILTDGAYLYYRDQSSIRLVDPGHGRLVWQCGFLLEGGARDAAIAPTGGAVLIAQGTTLANVKTHPDRDACHEHLTPGNRNHRALLGSGLTAGDAPLGLLALGSDVFVADTGAIYAFDWPSLLGKWESPDRHGPSNTVRGLIGVDVETATRSSRVVDLKVYAITDSIEGQEGFELVQLSPGTGEPTATVAISAAVDPLADDLGVVTATPDGVLVAYPHDLSTEEWRVDELPTTGLAQAGGLVVFAENHRLVAVDRLTGETRWMAEAGSNVVAVVATPGVAVAIDASGVITAWDLPGNATPAAAPAPTTPFEPPTPTEVVHALYAAWSRGDRQGMEQHLGIGATVTVRTLFARSGRSAPTTLRETLWTDTFASDYWWPLVEHSTTLNGQFDVSDCAEQESTSAHGSRVVCDVVYTNDLYRAAEIEAVSLAGAWLVDNGRVEAVYNEIPDMGLYWEIAQFAASQWPADYEAVCYGIYPLRPECDRFLLEHTPDWVESGRPGSQP